MTNTAPSYCNGFAPEFRIIELLDGGKECIHINMDYLSHSDPGETSAIKLLNSSTTVVPLPDEIPYEESRQDEQFIAGI